MRLSTSDHIWAMFRRSRLGLPSRTRQISLLDGKGNTYINSCSDLIGRELDHCESSRGNHSWSSLVVSE